MPNAAEKVFLDVVYACCSKHEIEALLREYKRLDRDNIKITAEDKEELVYENLREGLARGTIPHARVKQLIRDSEENDGHHHFYYHPRTKQLAKQLSDSEHVCTTLLGRKEMEGSELFELMPTRFAWAGFRTDIGGAGRPIGWTATLYGQENVQRREVVQRADETIIRLVTTPAKVVLVARWRNIGVLELRVPGLDPQELIDSMRERVWAELSEVVEPLSVVPWDIGPIRTQVARIALRNARSTPFTLGPCRGRGPTGASTTIRGATPSASAVNDPKQVQTLRVYARGGDNFDSQVVIWKQTEHAMFLPAQGLRTVLGPIRSTAEINEVIFSSRAGGMAADYVLNRLRELDPNRRRR